MMTQRIYEQISAWMDEELPAEEVPLLVRHLSGDEHLRARWERYHLIGDALRRRLPDYLNHQTAGKVCSALSNAETEADQVHPSTRSGFHSRWFKPLVGLAIAASVAIVAVLGVRAPEGPSAPQIASATPRGGVNLAAPGPVLVAPRRVASSGWDVNEPGVEERLNEYLVNHSEYATQAGMPGMLPYVRIVGYERSQ